MKVYKQAELNLALSFDRFSLSLYASNKLSRIPAPDMSKQVKSELWNGGLVDHDIAMMKIDFELRSKRCYSIATGEEVAKPEPSPAAANATADVKAEKHQRYQRWWKEHVDYEKRKAEIIACITKHVDDNVLRALAVESGDPAKMYKLMQDLGKGATDAQNEMYYFEVLTKMKMESNEQATTFLPRFHHAKVKSMVRDNVAGGLLMKAMPPRMKEQVHHCENAHLSYDEIKTFLTEHDSLWHARNPEGEDTALKKVQRAKRGKDDRKLAEEEDSSEEKSEDEEDRYGRNKFSPKTKCFNCCNMGHYSSQCRAKYCGRCGGKGHRQDQEDVCAESRNKKKSSKTSRKIAGRIIRSGYQVSSSEDEEDDDETVYTDVSG